MESMAAARPHTRPSIAWLVGFLLLPGTLRADQVIRQARIRAPRNQADPTKPLPESPTPTVRQPWDQRTEPRPLRKGKKGWHPVATPHDREWPTFYADPVARIYNGAPRFGAGLPLVSRRQAVRPETPSRSEGLLGSGGLKGRIRRAIREDRARRYQERLEGLQLMEQYRAEKALLGLCPVDGCEESRFVLEGKSFSPQGHCRLHSEELYGKRVDWALSGAEGRRRRREARWSKFRKRWHSGARFRDRPGQVPSQPGDSNATRATIGQPPRPSDFPRPGDLGPVGTQPAFADPRDPAGFPYDRIDAAPPAPDGPEARSWVHVSRSAP